MHIGYDLLWEGEESSAAEVNHIDAEGMRLSTQQQALAHRLLCLVAFSLYPALCLLRKMSLAHCALLPGGYCTCPCIVTVIKKDQREHLDFILTLQDHTKI